MGYRVKPFTMAVRDNSTQQFIDVGLLGSDVAQDIEELEQHIDEVEDELDKRAPWLTPEMFGAKADGVTDDTAAFQAAVDACVEGTRILLYGSVYRIEGTVNISTPGIMIMGMGYNNLYTRIQALVQDGNTFNITCAGVGFAYIRFNGSGLGLNSTCVLNFDGSSINGNVDADVFHCQFNGMQYGIKVAGRNLHVDNGGFGSVRYAITYNMCSNTAIECRGHRVENVRFHGTSYCITNNIDHTTSVPRSVKIVNCFFDAQSLMFYSGFNGGVDITGNTFYADAANSGVLIFIKKLTDTTDTRYDVIKNNTICGNGRDIGFVRTEAGCRVIVSDNYIEHTQRAAIYVSANSKCVVTGNTCIDCMPSYYAIAAETGTTGIISNNNVIGSVSGIVNQGTCTVQNNITI